MNYSSAIWSDHTRNLAEAQDLKNARILQMLDLKPGHSVLEIGCGWGALSARLAACGAGRVTALTLSPSQLGWAQAVVDNVGFSKRVDLRLQDYRDVAGTFDRIVSIEMLEAVGEAYWPSYFSALARSLSRDGRAVLQVISIAENRFESYRSETDFIQKHIFPGGFLPSKTHLRGEIQKAGLTFVDAEFFGHSYARTLADWRSRFLASWPVIAALGFDERFRRLWHYYLSYCEAGFMENTIDVGLYVIEHPNRRQV
jgi:cyclopropane-fatty-acyl-phospholipid synthase